MSDNPKLDVEKAAETVNRRASSIRKEVMPYLLIAPTVLFYVLFWMRPVVIAVINSLRDSQEGNFTLGNYAEVFTNTDFGEALFNTAFIAGVSVVIEFAIALSLALLINKKFKGAGVFLFLAMIPMAIPPVAAGAIWQTALTPHGWLNSLLYYLGFLGEGEKLYYLSGSRLSLMSLIIVIDAWQVIPSMMIILLAGLQNLPEEAKEAGYVFGGDRWTVLRKITIPMLRPTIITAVILRLISAIQIWLIVVLLLGYDRIPLLLERIVYYKEELSGLYNSYQIAATYSVLVAAIVSISAVAYLKLSGAFAEQGRDG